MLQVKPGQKKKNEFIPVRVILGYVVAHKCNASLNLMIYEIDD